MINPTTICSSGPEEDRAFQELLESVHDIIPDDSFHPALEVLARKEVISRMTERMAELPDTPKKVLAMYYYEKMRISEIAACFSLTESRICQIHTQTIDLLRNDLVKLLA